MHLGALWALLGRKGEGILSTAAQDSGHSQGYGGRQSMSTRGKEKTNAKKERNKDFSLNIFSSMHNTTYRASKPDNTSIFNMKYYLTQAQLTVQCQLHFHLQLLIQFPRNTFSMAPLSLWCQAPL